MHQQALHAESTQRAVDLVSTMVFALVDHPDAVRVEPIEGSQCVIFEVSVEASDIRKVIGRRGRTADAIRTILSNLASKSKLTYHLEVIEPENQLGQIQGAPASLGPDIPPADA